MNDYKHSIAGIAFGALILLASLTADMTGLGGHAGFGSKQMIGAVVGIIVLAMSVDLLRSSSNV